MGALSKCIKRAGKALTDTDRRALLSRYDAFVKDGMPASEAAEMSVTEAHDAVMEQIREAADLVRAKGVEVTITGGDLTQPEATAAPQAEAEAAPETPIIRTKEDYRRYRAQYGLPNKSLSPAGTPVFGKGPVEFVDDDTGKVVARTEVDPADLPADQPGAPEAPAAPTTTAPAQATLPPRIPNAVTSPEGARQVLKSAWGRRVTEALEKAGVLKYISRDRIAAELGVPQEDVAGIKGVYVNGVAYVVYDNMTAKDLPGVFLHEAGFHAIVENEIDQKLLDAVLGRLRKAVGRDPDVTRAAAAVPADTAPEHRDGEMGAYLVEQTPGHGLVQRLVDVMMGGLNKLGISTASMESDPALIRRVTREMLRFKARNLSRGARITDAGVSALRQAQSDRERLKDKIASFDAKFSMSAWHGSPHDHDGFSMEKIGTGEGAQVYGWGLYFAGKKEVAEHYRKGLTNRQLIELARDSYDESFDPQEAFDALMAEPRLSDAQRELVTALNDDGWLGFDYPHQAISAAFREAKNFDLSDATKAALAKQGRLYQVELAPDEGDYLDWDAPLSEQSEKVKAALAKEPLFRTDMPEMQSRPGRDFLSLAEGYALGSKEEGAKALRALGIPGIRYLDGTSRGAGEGSRNYVIFDDSLVKISAKFSRYTPAEAEARARMGVPPEQRSTVRRIVDTAMDLYQRAHTAFFESGDTIIQAVFDGMHGVRMAEQRLEKRIGRSLGIDDSAYVAMRLANGLPSIMEGVLLHGSPEWNAGIVQKKAGSVGLLDALDPVAGDLDDWLVWMVANRAQTLMGQGRENNMTAADIAYGLSLAADPATLARFVQARDAYNQIKSDILDFAEQAGVIEPAGIDANGNPTGRAVWDSIEYLPFYRVTDPAGVSGNVRRAPRKGKAGPANQRNPVTKLRGGENALRDPLANIVQNFTLLIDTSLKNNAMRQAVNVLGIGIKDKQGNITQDGEFFKADADWRPTVIPMQQIVRELVKMGVSKQALQAMPPSALKGMQKLMSMSPPSGPNVVSVLENGKPKYYEVPDQFLLDSLLAFGDPPQFGAIVKNFLHPISKALTVSITRHPLFMLRNYSRDVQSTYIQSDISPFDVAETARFLRDSITGVAKSYTQTGLGEFLMFSGASFSAGYVSGTDPDASSTSVRRSLRNRARSNPNFIPGNSVREKALAKIVRLPVVGAVAHPMLKPMLFPVESAKSAWDRWDAIGSAVENGTREAMAEHIYRTTGNPRAMAYESRDVIDFSMHGNSSFIRHMAVLFPFFNARLQGLYKLYRSGQIDQGYLKSVFVQKLALFAFGSIGNAVLNATLFADAYDDLSETEKDQYIHIGPGQPWGFRIPKAFELGIIANTVPERLVRAAEYQLTEGQRGDTPRNSAWAVWGALWGTMGLNPVPQFAAPAVEVIFNFDMFRRRPIENMGDLREPNPANRSEWYTSETAKAVAGAIPRRANELAQISPKDIEHLVSGYVGMIGGEVLAFSDMLIRELDPDNPMGSKDLADWFGKFASVRDVPLLGTFVRGDAEPQSTKWNDELYHLNDLVTAASVSAKQARLAAGDPALAASRQADADAFMARAGGMLGRMNTPNEFNPDGTLTPGAKAARRSEAKVSFEGARELKRTMDTLRDLREQMGTVSTTRGVDWKVKREQIEALRKQYNELTESTVKRLRRQQRQWEAQQPK